MELDRSRRAGLAAVATLALVLGTTSTFGIAPASADPAPSCQGDNCTVSFGYTGGAQSWTVPDGVSSVRVWAQGAQGGSYQDAAGGKGGLAMGTLAVTPGQVLDLRIGGAGSYTTAGGYGGGGNGHECTGPGNDASGGGGTYVSTGTTLLLVAGGGGGGMNFGEGNVRAGGTGGGANQDGGGVLTYRGYGDEGGTAYSGGYSGYGASGSGPATATSFGQGGNAQHQYTCPNGGGGGGGGGYYGGAGGGSAGGGASGYADSALTDVSGTSGVNSGDGSLSIVYNIGLSVSTSSTTDPSMLDPATYGTFYSETLSASRGTAPYAFTQLPDSTLPSGVSFDEATATLSGSPQQTGTFYLHVQVTDSSDPNKQSQATLPFEVDKATQQVTFTSTAPNDAVVGDTYTPTVRTGLSTASPQVSASPSSVCSVNSASQVSFDHVGQCTVSVNQAGDDNYDDAIGDSQVIAVGQASQTLTFGTAPTAPGIGDSYVPQVMGGDSGNAVELSTTSHACTVTATPSGSYRVDFVHAGSCEIDAVQQGDEDYTEGTNSQTVTVAKSAQTVVITSAPTTPAVGGTYGLTATGGGSGNPVTYSTTSSACTVNGSSVSFLHAGTCAVAANQAGDDDHDAATTTTQTITVAKGERAVVITSSAPSGAAVGGTYTPTTNPSSATLSTSSACSAAGGKVTFDHAGTCTVTATLAADADYNQTSMQQQVSVGKADQQVSITSTAPSSAGVGATYTPVVKAGPSSSAPVVSATPSSVCSVTATGVVRFDHAGRCTVSVSQAGDSDYTDATVTSAPQQITVSKGASTTKVALTASAVTATVSAGAVTASGSVAFTLAGKAIGSATLSNGVATLKYAVPTGAARTVTATYAGTDEIAGSTGSVTRRDPTISAHVATSVPINAAGWYRVPLTVVLNCTPGSAELTYCSPKVRLTYNGADRSLTGKAAAADGGAAQVPVSINLDTEDPSARLQGVAQGYHYATPPKVTCVADDATSGVDSCTVTRTVKGHEVTWTATAVDVAGNVTVVERTANVDKP